MAIASALLDVGRGFNTRLDLLCHVHRPPFVSIYVSNKTSMTAFAKTWPGLISTIRESVLLGSKSIFCGNEWKLLSYNNLDWNKPTNATLILSVLNKY